MIDPNKTMLPPPLGMAAILAVLTATAQGSPEVVSSNLAANPSFEEAAADGKLPAQWSGDREVYRINRDVARTGGASLEFVNQDPDRYRLATQRIDLEPGGKYRIRVWVKTEDLRGVESGATICVEWRDEQGNWLGGLYPSGVKGTGDWTRVEGVARLPAEARDFTLSCYVRRGMTGRAWFDDVQVVRLADPPLQTMLVSPVYRGWITADAPERVQLRVALNLLDVAWEPHQLLVAVKLADRNGRIVDWTGQPAAEPSPEPVFDDRAVTTLEFPARQLPVGQYQLIVRLFGPEGNELQSAVHRLARLPDDFQPRSTIDQHRRLLVDGEPMFPLGMYFSSIREEELKVFAQSKFNCLMAYASPTAAQMDLADRHGIKVIYSIKDWYFGSKYCPPDIRSIADEEPKIRERVRQFRDHPALLAWYLNDELPQSFMPQLEAHQRIVEEEDPDHPTWAVLYQYREVADYRNTFDAIGTDPYPIGRAAASQAAEWTAETFRQVQGARPMWQVPQVFNWGNYPSIAPASDQQRTPTFDEMRSMAWQCIAEGATGLIFYSWYDVRRNPDVPFETQWQHLKNIAAEIDRHAPALLSIEPVPAVKAGGVTGADPPAWLRWTARRHGGRLYLFAVNDGDGEGEFTFMFPGAPRSVRVVDEDRPVKIDGAGFRDELSALQVRVYAIESDTVDPSGN